MSFELHQKVAGKMSGREKASALFKRPLLDSIHTYRCSMCMRVEH